MRNFKYLMIAAFAGVVALSSCSVEKRVHMAGYNVKFNKSYKGADDVKEVNNEFEEKNVAEAKKFILKDKQNTSIDKIEMRSAAQVDFVATLEELPQVKKVVKGKSISVGYDKTTQESLPEHLGLIENKENLKGSSEGTESITFSQDAKADRNKHVLADDMTILILLLCFFLPPLAVWLMTEDAKLTIISVLLSLLFWLPGVIFALFLFLKRY